MSGLRVKDNMPKLLKSLHALLRQEVLVGIPAENAEREEVGSPINNATIGYIQENGAPDANIPARPFLVPGVENAKDDIAARFGKAARAGLVGDVAEVDRQLNAAGLIAQNSVKAVINAGIDPALSDATIEARAKRGRKGAIQEQKNRLAGMTPSTQLAKPLIDTGELRSKITYVKRTK